MREIERERTERGGKKKELEWFNRALLEWDGHFEAAAQDMRERKRKEMIRAGFMFVG